MPTYFIGLIILLTRQGGDFTYSRNNPVIPFLYPGRLGKDLFELPYRMVLNAGRGELTGIHQQNY